MYPSTIRRSKAVELFDDLTGIIAISISIIMHQLLFVISSDLQGTHSPLTILLRHVLTLLHHVHIAHAPISGLATLSGSEQVTLEHGGPPGC